ncbi:MAG: hypothetical protein ACJ73S_13915 [Mycobacteriales bacterium]
MNDRPALAVAERAADWLIGLRAAERTDDLSLSRGTAGVLAFFLHAARAYDEPRDLAQACAAGDVLAAAIRTCLDGDLGGIAWALRELATSTGEARYAAGVRTAVDRLATADPSPDGALALLRLGEVELALGQARALAAGGRPAGTAVAYALAAVGAAAGDADLSGAARRWAEDRRATGELSARVPAVLAAADPSWWETAGRLAAAARNRGVPESPFRRGGSAGLADWMLSLHHLAVAGQPVGDPAELVAFARTLTADLTARAVVDRAGARWLPAETGWARGAAGIGSWLVRFDTFEQGRESVLRLPDSPW